MVRRLAKYCISNSEATASCCSRCGIGSGKNSPAEILPVTKFIHRRDVENYVDIFCSRLVLLRTRTYSELPQLIGAARHQRLKKKVAEFLNSARTEWVVYSLPLQAATTARDQLKCLSAWPLPGLTNNSNVLRRNGQSYLVAGDLDNILKTTLFHGRESLLS